LVATIAACGGAQHGRRTGDEYLAGVRLVGNHAVEDGEIIDGLGLHRAEESGRPLDPYLLTVDTERVKTLYQKRGFFEVDVRSTVELKDKAQYAVITIVEGRRARTTVVISGLPADVDPAGARALVELAEGDAFDYEKFDEAKEPLVTYVENFGYAHVVMDAEVIADATHAQATVRYVFDPGPPCVFGEITISGVDGALADAIRARLWFRPGERYAQQALVETQRMIYELGRFSSARVEADRNSGSELIPVRIAVVEANRYESKLGGGFGYEPLTFEARARASISAAKLPDDLSTASLDFRPAYTVDHNFANPEPKIRLLALLTRLDLFRPLIKGELEGGLDYVTVEAYTYTGAHAALGFSAPLGFRWLQFRVGWLLQEVTFSKLDALVDAATATRLGLDRDQRLGEYQQALSVDLRDDPINPHKGVYLELKTAEGTKYAGGKFTLFQFTPEARGFIPLGKSVLALRARVGMILGDVPVTERYYSGGASSQRGFSERRLSPSIEKLPIGGAGTIEVGVELRSPSREVLGLVMGGVAFLDGGDVTENVSGLDPTNLHWATGFGVRIDVIKSVVARFDLGFRLNRTNELVPAPDVLDRLALHLGIGQAF
ncbi:MAG: BamA/TamA family outer membrane protein, partial [Proteobacteria bacterium]|nr:BamA/TamA family outer membrane protein [Pseudomonadota bacterium]